uniref:Uncharacterized protein n=1 Tax=Strongyloides stercoralis TaxID=6248 RepID=A0AAF5DIZ1_STRER
MKPSLEQNLHVVGFFSKNDYRFRKILDTYVIVSSSNKTRFPYNLRESNEDGENKLIGDSVSIFYKNKVQEGEIIDIGTKEDMLAAKKTLFASRTGRKESTKDNSLSPELENQSHDSLNGGEEANAKGNFLIKFFILNNYRICSN